MRILVLSSVYPSRFRGGEIRLLYLLKYLSIKHKISLCIISPSEPDQAQLARELPRCKIEIFDTSVDQPQPLARLIDKHWYWRLNQFRISFLQPLPKDVLGLNLPPIKRRLESLMATEEFDLIHINQIFSWQFLPKRMGIPCLLSNDNVWSIYYERVLQATVSKKSRFWNYLEALKMRRYERRAVEAANCCVVVSDNDRELMQRLAPQAKVSVVPNGVDTEYFLSGPMPEQETLHLVFTGTFEWAPNVDAMLYFCEDIFPRVLDKMPQVCLTIVGMNPPVEILALANNSNIQVADSVPDVRPYLAAASVVVVPLRLGSGTRLKILEALSMGKAVVSTSLGAEGLNVKDGIHLRLADSPADFAAVIVELLEKPERAHLLGSQGRMLVEAIYDWKRLASQLEEVYYQVIQQN